VADILDNAGTLIQDHYHEDEMVLESVEVEQDVMIGVVPSSEALTPHCSGRA
jgi:hypothetical protein